MEYCGRVGILWMVLRSGAERFKWPLSPALPVRVLVVDASVVLVVVGVVVTEESAVTEAGTVTGLQKEIEKESYSV